jgi:hypothetical protein
LFVAAGAAGFGGEAKGWQTRENAKVSPAIDGTRGAVIQVDGDFTKAPYTWVKINQKLPASGFNALRLWIKPMKPISVGFSLVFMEGKTERKFRNEQKIAPGWQELVLPFSSFLEDGASVTSDERARVSSLMFSFTQNGDSYAVFLQGLEFIQAAEPEKKARPPEMKPMAIPALPPHPRLLFNQAGLEAFIQKTKRAPWAEAWKARLDACEKSLATPLSLPPRGGNWSHNYVCPQHGSRLKLGRQTGEYAWEHICPVGNHILLGDPSKAVLDFDGNALSSIHGAFPAELTRLALASRVTGKKEYAARAREILLAYAGKYRAYPLHDNQGKPGRGARVHSQSLTEASWLIGMLQGADLLWGDLSAADREHIEKNLIRAALEDVILKSSLGIHNIQCRLNSAIGLSGLLLGDEALIRRAIERPGQGMLFQLKEGVQEDGVWREGAWGYHFFTIEGMWPLLEAARNCGIDLYLPEFKKLFDAPLDLASPTFVLPAFNDSGETKIAAPLYELAYARFKDARYGAILKDAPRTGELSLFFGEDAVGGAADFKQGSRNAEASGYAILQKGAGTNATWFCLKYGPHGGGHGHPDKLSFVIYARGQNVAVDPGTRAYGSPVHSGWDKTSFAHNTLTIDQASQQEATGKCLAFGSHGGADFVVADAGPIWAEVRFVRAVVMMHENLIVFIDQVESKEPRTYDLVYHQRGAWQPLSVGKPWDPGKEAGYRYVLDGREYDGATDANFTCRVRPDFSTAVHVLGEPGATIFVGTGIGDNTEDRVPLLIMRKQAALWVSTWAISLDGSAVKLAREAGTKGVSVRVEQGGMKKKVILLAEGKGVRVE